MYLWIGLGLVSLEEASLRDFCRSKNPIGIPDAALLLPQHISLKTSFETERYREIDSPDLRQGGLQ